MKKLRRIILAVLLGCMLGTAFAEENFTIQKIEDAEGYDEIFRSMVVDNTVHLLSTRRNL